MKVMILHPIANDLMQIGVTGFEPAASWSQTRRSDQTEPHPDQTTILYALGAKDAAAGTSTL